MSGLCDVPALRDAQRSWIGMPEAKPGGHSVLHEIFHRAKF